MSENIVWYTAYDSGNEKRIIATYGVSEGKICAIAYHYDFRDFNRDGKTTISEKTSSFLTFGHTDEKSMNLSVAYDFYHNHLDEDYNSAGEYYRKSFLTWLNDIRTITTKSVDFVYFSTLVGFGISQSLTAFGINGIKNFVYTKAIKSALKGVVKN